jgi:hypothetical protein
MKGLLVGGNGEIDLALQLAEFQRGDERVERKVHMKKTEELATMSIEDIRTHARTMRLRSEQASATFLISLMQIEETCMKQITDSGCDDFAAFLRAEDLCDFARYDRFKRGAEVIGVRRALEIGEHATKEHATLPEIARQEFESLIGDWQDKHRSVAPSQQAAAKLAAQARAKVGAPRPLVIEGRRDELSRLRAENAKLKADVAQRDKALAKANREIADLRQKLGLRQKRPVTVEATA